MMKPLTKFSLGTGLLATPPPPHRESASSVRQLPAVLISRRFRRAFTLVELLTVVAVIGILASLLFPAVRAARASANRASTRVEYNQWAAAIEGFRSEYGFYPSLHSSNLVNPSAQNADPATLHLFHDLLAARRRDGTPLPAYAVATNTQFPEVQNRRQLSFFSFREADLTSGNLLCDAGGNTVIAVLVDKNLDGVIQVGSDFTVLPAVNGLTPSGTDFPVAGVRAGVIFYSAVPGSSGANPEFIFSWK